MLLLCPVSDVHACGSTQSRVDVNPRLPLDERVFHQSPGVGAGWKNTTPVSTLRDRKRRLKGKSCSLRLASEEQLAALGVSPCQDTPGPTLSTVGDSVWGLLLAPGEERQGRWPACRLAWVDAQMPDLM